MQRLYRKDAGKESITVTDSDTYHQITRVLRLHPGAVVSCFSEGKEWKYKIEEIQKKSVLLIKGSIIVRNTTPSRGVTLFQALPNKHEKIEYILQKCSEIGVSRFVFFRSERSQKLVISSSKEERFGAIVREAIEQCGGTVLPEICFVENYEDKWSREIPSVVLHTTSGEEEKIDSSTSDIQLFVGPEGGFSEQEIQKMVDNGFITVQFGERILRTETAAVVGAFWLLQGL